MTAPQARAFWKALMDNASRLVEDAHTLIGTGSWGRARSLMVLAQEELGKALWVYDTFESAWSAGDSAERTVERLADGRNHVRKYLGAMVYGDKLAQFWGDYSAYRSQPGETREGAFQRLAEERTTREAQAEVAAREANRSKQLGFYADLSEDGSVTSPADIDLGTLREELQVAAQVVEMLLISDHTRMQRDGGLPVDNTYAQQSRLLPISHPEDWVAASEQARRGASDGSRGDETPRPGEDA